MMITQLGILQTDAAQRGDDRAAVTLRDVAQHLLDVHGDLSALERRRAKDRKRKRSADSAESVESTDSVDGSQGFPTPLPNSPDNNNTTPARSDQRNDDPTYDDAVEQYAALLSAQMGEHFADADGFVKRRPYATWKGWLRELLTNLTGGKALPADVAQVCRDDAALDRKVGSPKGFRIFVASAVEERLRPPSGAGAGNSTTPGTGARREHWSETKAREEQEGAERQRIAGVVNARKARRDGDLWWTRMQREAGSSKLGDVLKYAANHLEESGAPTHV